MGTGKLWAVSFWEKEQRSRQGAGGQRGGVYSRTWFSSLAATPETNQMCVCSQGPKGPRP